MSLLDECNYNYNDNNLDKKVQKDIEEIDRLIKDLNEINEENNLFFCYLFYINYIYNINTNKTVVIYDSTFSNNIYWAYLYILDYYAKLIIDYLSSDSSSLIIERTS
jgi:hypothetical protein